MAIRVETGQPAARQSIAITLWYSDPPNVLTSRRVERSTQLTFNPNVPFALTCTDLPPARPVVQPIAAQGNVFASVAVLFIPDTLQHELSLNGIPLPAGMHGLAHADRLDGPRQSYWIARYTEAMRTQYDPAIHGPGLSCFLTKAPLEPGQEITICPGTPDTSCNAIYKTSTWEKLMRSGAPFKCSQCGYHPGLPTWTPTPPAEGKRGHEYFKYFDS